MTRYPLLLSPLKIGSVEVRNRVVSTAHGAFLDYGLDCEVMVSTALAELSDGSCVLRHLHSGRRERRPIDLVVAGVPGQPELDLYAAARRNCPHVALAGDVVAPRSAMHAFREGDGAGRAI